MKQGMRGMLTPEIKAKAEAFLGREFAQKELRLYPYLQFCIMNSQKIDRGKTDQEEQEILSMLESEKHLKREYPSTFHPTRKFWEFMSGILADGYVNTAEEYTEELNQ